MQSPSERLEPGIPLSFSYGMLNIPRFSTVTAAFQYHVAVRPHAIAARDLSTEPPSQITYGELATRSARLVRKLQGLGVVPGGRVPLVVKSGIDMLVGTMSFLSCRSQYMPLDGAAVSDATCLVNRGTLILLGIDWQKVLQEARQIDSRKFIRKSRLIALQIDVLMCTPSLSAKYDPVHSPNTKVVTTAGEPSSQRYISLESYFLV